MVQISYILCKLRDQALKWAEAYLSKHPFCCYVAFLGEFKRTIAHPISEGSSAQKVINLCQGPRSIADYLIDFRTAAEETGWPDRALH